MEDCRFQTVEVRLKSFATFAVSFARFAVKSSYREGRKGLRKVRKEIPCWLGFQSEI